VKLICDHLLPLAYEGLERRGIESGDAARYLSVIDKRVASGRTGAQWQAISLGGMRGQGNLSERLNALTAAMVERQKGEEPVADWPPARLVESSGWKQNFLKVEQYMSTDLFTVGEDESLDLVASVMEWKRIRHIPVEDGQHRLVGLISYRSLLKLMARGLLTQQGNQLAVSEVMNRDPVTVSPGSSTLEAIELMRQHEISCLPVVSDDHLVGVITERDLMNVAATLLEQQLKS
jgi:CBS domain-containing protein